MQTKFVKIHRPDIAGTATVPESALDRYLRDGWTVVDESGDMSEAEDHTPPTTPSAPNTAASAESRDEE